MKSVSICASLSLVFASLVVAKGDQRDTLDGISAVRMALKAGNVSEARRQALLAIDKALAVLPPCGTVSGLGNPNYFAFPTGEVQRVFIERYDLLGFYDLRSGKVKRIWSVGLGNGKSMLATNTFSRYFAPSRKLKVEFECGKQPKFNTELTLFEVTMPPGNTVAGILKPSGVFTPLVTRAFDTFSKSSGQSRYRQWIIPVPGNR